MQKNVAAVFFSSASSLPTGHFAVLEPRKSSVQSFLNYVKFVDPMHFPAQNSKTLGLGRAVIISSYHFPFLFV